MAKSQIPNYPQPLLFCFNLLPKLTINSLSTQTYALCCMMVKNYCRLSFYTTESPIIKQNFLKQIRSTFGAGGFVCYLTEKELSEFHQHLERNFPFQHQDRVKKGVITLCRETARHQYVGAKQAPTRTYMKIGYRASPSMPGNPLVGQALSLQTRVCHTPALTCSATYDCHFNHLDHCVTFCS